MLIDDNELDNIFHEYVLRKSGIAEDVLALESGEAALAYLEAPDSPPVDLILVDINMPGMNGFEFIEACQRLARPAKQVIIAMLTSSPSVEEVERTVGYGDVKQYVTKPLSVEMSLDIAERYF
ncbi:MAG: response regulator [Usitatibacteraceae bacterium]